MMRHISGKTRIFGFLVMAVLFTGGCSSNNTSSGRGSDGHPSIMMKEYTTYTPKTSWKSEDDASYEAMTALQVSELMGNGINLGNTMEATSSSFGFDAADASVYETAWGQPKTTADMFAAYKAAGFSSVRIPVAWTHTMDWSHGDLQINRNYLERVAQVVTWALDAGLFVMINDHWDYQWWGMFSHDEDVAWQIYSAIWTQVGAYFKDFSYKLIFEGGNEELGDRFNDVVDSSADGRLTTISYSTRGTLSSEECYALLKKVNQKFVDIIRAQGGNNERRFLLIPGYDTDINKTCAASYSMPDDSTNSVQKLFVSVHYYTPSNYCILSEDASWGKAKNSWTKATEGHAMNTSFAKLTRFTQAGYGVIIGEYGVAQRKNSDGSYSKKDGMEDWITLILDNCDKYNFCPFLWDCNTFFIKNTDSAGNVIGFADTEVAAIYKNR